MKKCYKAISILWLLWFFTSVVSAQSTMDPMQLPQLTQWVTDFSNSLSLSQLDELNIIAKDYETQSSNQIVAVVFPHRNGNELIDIGMKIFTDNLIGKKDMNNGLLLIISSEEKKIRIIVWYGLEGVYPDLMASQVIENDIRPLVNSGDIAGAINIFYERSKQIIWWEIPLGYSTISWATLLYMYVFFGFILGYILRFFYKKKKIKNHFSKYGNNFWIAIFVGIAVIIILTFVTQFVLYFLMWLIFGRWWVWVGIWGWWWGFGSWWWSFGSWWWGFGGWWWGSWGWGSGD